MYLIIFKKSKHGYNTRRHNSSIPKHKIALFENRFALFENSLFKEFLNALPKILKLIPHFSK